MTKPSKASNIVKELRNKINIRIKMCEEHAEAARQRGSMYPCNFRNEAKVEKRWLNEIEANKIVEKHLAELDEKLLISPPESDTV